MVCSLALITAASRQQEKCSIYGSRPVGAQDWGEVYGKWRIFGVSGVDFFDFSKNSPFLEIGWFLRRDGGVVQHVRARGTAAKRRTAWPMSDQWKANVKQAKPRGKKR